MISVPTLTSSLCKETACELVADQAIVKKYDYTATAINIWQQENPRDRR